MNRLTVCNGGLFAGIGRFKDLERKVADFSAFKIKFVPEKREPYSFYIGKLVEIISAGNKFTGIYRGLRDNDDELILYPSLETQFYPESPVQNGSNNGIRIYQLSELPTIITRNGGLSIGGVGEKYVCSLLKQSEEILERSEEIFEKIGDLSLGNATL